MTKNTNRSLKVFLCHASSDKPEVWKLYSRLVNDGVDAWLDKEKLIPGQNWQIEIPKAVRNSDVVIVCLSSKSISKEGFVQKEIKIALDAADEKPEGTIFIIPARLEECNIPERISQFHWVDLYSENGYEWLLKALSLRASTIDLSFKPENKKPKEVNELRKDENLQARSLNAPQIVNTSARNNTKNWFAGLQEWGEIYLCNDGMLFNWLLVLLIWDFIFYPPFSDGSGYLGHEWISIAMIDVVLISVIFIAKNYLGNNKLVL